MALKRLGFLAVCLLAGCDDGMTTGEAEDKVRALLRDPSSAEFTSEVRHPPTQDRGAVVCGEVNARNASGGMTGPRRFVAGGLALIDDPTSDTAHEVFEGSWRKFCG